MGGKKNRGQEMTDWTALLKKEMPTPYINRRPFVCDGFPSASKLMVIGENPGTKRNQDWWADWNAKTGYDYDTFIADYKMKKTIKGVRLRFEHLRNKIRVKCIETNVWQNEGDKKESRTSNIEVLRLLIDNNENLKVVIVHGREAQCQLGVPPTKQEGVALYPASLGRLPLPKGVAVYPTVHFIFIKFCVLEHICSEKGL